MKRDPKNFKVDVIPDDPRSARSAADQEADRCVDRIKDAVKAMDCRNKASE